MGFFFDCISSKKLRGCILQSELPFVPIHCIIYAAIK
jgi:hypothetical protein